MMLQVLVRSTILFSGLGVGSAVLAADGAIPGAETPKSAVAAVAPVTPIVPVTQVPNLRGTWSGHWSSNTNRHQGPMSATFTPLNANQYQVQFKARFLKLVPFRYTSV